MRLKIILRSMLSNWAGYFVTVLVGFFLSPFIVRKLGGTGYGVWTLVVSLTGYFGLLDLGLRHSVGRFVTRYMALDDEDNVNRTLSSAVALLACGSAMALCATAALVMFGTAGFNIDAHYRDAACTALTITGLNVGLALPLSSFSTILLARERFDVMSAISVTGALTRAALTMAALQSGYGLVALAVITVSVSALEYTATVVMAHRLYAALKIRWRYVSAAACRELFGFGIYRFVWIVSNQLIFYTDSVIIGAFLSVSAITPYAIAASLINYGRNIVSLAMDSFYPAATRLDAHKDLKGLHSLLAFATGIALVIGLPLCAGYVFLGRQFITLWMGREFAESADILAILGAAQIASLPQYISALILVAMARHRMLAVIALAEAVLNVGLSVVLVQKFGVWGVAVGMAAPHVLATGLAVPFCTLRALHLRPAEYLSRAWLRPTMCALPAVAACWALSHSHAGATWPRFVMELLCVGAVLAVSVWCFFLTPAQRESLAGKMHHKRYSRAAAAEG